MFVFSHAIEKTKTSRKTYIVLLNPFSMYCIETTKSFLMLYYTLKSIIFFIMVIQMLEISNVM